MPPWTFRSLCLGLGSAVLFVALRAGGQRLAVPNGQWGGSALLAFLNITCWNMLVAFGVAHDPVGARRDPRLHHADLGGAAVGVAARRAHHAARSWSASRSGSAALALLLGESFVGLGARAARLAAGARRRADAGRSARCCRSAFRCACRSGPTRRGSCCSAACRSSSARVAVRGLARAARTSACAPALGMAYNVFIAFAFAHWAWIKIATSVPVSVFSDQHAAHPGGRRGERHAVPRRAADAGPSTPRSLCVLAALALRCCGQDAAPRG